MTQGNGKNRGHGAEIVASLMWGKRSVRELVEIVDCNEETARCWLDALHEAGVVRIAAREKLPRGGLKRLVFAIQPSPFALPDAP